MKKQHFLLFPFSFFLRCLRAVYRRVRRALLTRPIHVTRFGLFYILFSIAVGAAAINTGNNLLYLILGLLLGFIIVSGFLSDSCLWGLETDWQPAADFYAGQPAEMDVRVSKSWFPAVLVYLEPEWGDKSRTRHLLYWVARHQHATFRLNLAPPQRGRLRLSGIRYSTCFPFGLLEKSYRHRADESWVVFPRVTVLALNQLQAPGLALSAQALPQKGLGTTPFDLRDFRIGDSRKRIHWKTSAKRQRLTVTEMEDERDIRQHLHIRLWPGSDTAAREDFISFVASLAFTFYQNGKRVGLSTPGAFFPAEHSRDHLKKLLTYLALLDPAAEAILPAPLQRTSDAMDVVALWESVKRA